MKRVFRRECRAGFYMIAGQGATLLSSLSPHVRRSLGEGGCGRGTRSAVATPPQRPVPASPQSTVCRRSARQKETGRGRHIAAPTGGTLLIAGWLEIGRAHV